MRYTNHSDDRVRYTTMGEMPRRRGPFAAACGCLGTLASLAIGLLGLLPVAYFAFYPESAEPPHVEVVHVDPGMTSGPGPVVLPMAPRRLGLADLSQDFQGYSELDPAVIGDLSSLDVVAALPRIYAVAQAVEPDAVLTFAQLDRVDRQGRLDAVGAGAQFLFVSAGATARNADKPGLFVHLTGGTATLTRTTSVTTAGEAAPASPVPCPLPKAYAATPTLPAKGPYTVGIHWNGDKKRWAWAVTDPSADVRVPWVWADDCKAQ